MNLGFDTVAKSKKQIALIVAVLFVIGSLLSAVFIFTHLDHEHDQNSSRESCAVCTYISTAEKLLRSVAAALIGSAFVIGCINAFHFVRKSNELFASKYTLVSMKVKLSI